MKENIFVPRRSVSCSVPAKCCVRFGEPIEQYKMRCAGILVRARNSTVRGGRHFSSGSAHGQVSRYTAVVPRVADCVEFYTEALKLRVQRNVPDKLLILGDGARNSCDVGLSQVPTSSPANASTEPKLRYPYLTFGVSNLKTAARHAKRKQGIVGVYCCHVYLLHW